MQRLLEKILYLNPDARCSAWGNDRDKYRGESEPVLLDGYLVDWQPSNELPCPTQAELDAVSKVDADASAESRRKAARNEHLGKDLSIKAAYKLEKKGNRDLRFSDYLDQLEAEEVE